MVLPDGNFTDAWFWWFRPELGCFVMIHPVVGYGPHSGSANVHYVGSKDGGHGVLAVIPRRDVKFFDRHQARAQRSGTAGG